MKKKLTIGRKDKIDFPEFNLQDIDIKMDTGAYTSSIHCHKIGTKEKDGKEVVVFTLLDPSHPQYDNKDIAIAMDRGAMALTASAPIWKGADHDQKNVTVIREIRTGGLRVDYADAVKIIVGV